MFQWKGKNGERDFAWGPHVRLGRQTQETRKGGNMVSQVFCKGAVVILLKSKGLCFCEASRLEAQDSWTQIDIGICDTERERDL